MKKNLGFQLDAETLELYGEGDTYTPESFQEYYSLKEGVEDLVRHREDLILGLHRAFSSLVVREADEAGEFPPFPPISREDILWDTRDTKALMQVPYVNMMGLMGRTLYSSDKTSARYIGKGIFGANDYRNDTGKELSNYAVEMRFLRSGQGKAYIFDPKTLARVPLLGAVVAPSRQKLLRPPNKASDNPHQGYLYDGLSDPDSKGKQLPLANVNEKGSYAGRYDRGVHVPFKHIVNKIETSLGAPLNPSLQRSGKVGTSLEPPHSGPGASFGDEESDLPPATRGYRPIAPTSGGRMSQADTGGDERNTRFGDEGKTGGSGTFEDLWSRYIRGMGENPSMFSQRLVRYLLHRERRYTKEPLLPWPDKDNRPSSAVRKPTGLVTATGPAPLTQNYPPRLTQQELDARIERLAVHLKREPTPEDLKTAGLGGGLVGQYRRRNRREPVPYDPRRDRVEPATKGEMTPERRESLLAFWTNVQNYGDPNWVAAQAAQHHGTEAGEQFRMLAQDPARAQKMAAHAKEQVARLSGQPQVYAKPVSFTRGKEMEDSGRVYPRGHKKQGQPILVPKQQTVRNPDGSTSQKDIPTEHLIHARKTVLPNLFTLSAAADPRRPITISKALAQEIADVQKSERQASQVVLQNSDGSKEDEVIVQNYGKSRDDQSAVTFVVGGQAGNGRFFVFPNNKIYEKYKCCWAMTDQHGEVMFQYKPDHRPYTQPVLAPGALNTFMGNNPTAYGGHSAAPQGAGEALGHRDKKSQMDALYGPPDAQGNYRRDQQVTDPPSEWTGMTVPIQKYIDQGIDYYINRKVDNQDLKAELSHPAKRGDIFQYAHLYALQNLNNPKLLDFKGAPDAHMNLRYTRAQFPHLHATMMLLDDLVREQVFNKAGEDTLSSGDNPEPGNPKDFKVTRLPSKMTFRELDTFLSMPTLKRQLNTYPFHVKVATKLLATPAGQWKKSFANPGGGPDRSSFQYHLDTHGVQHPVGGKAGPISGPRARTMIAVDTKTIRRMMKDAQTMYIKWIGKDMVRKVVNSEKNAKNGEMVRGGVAGALIDDAYEVAEKGYKEQKKAMAAAQTGKGYARFRGDNKLGELIDELRSGPAILKQEYERRKEEFDRKVQEGQPISNGESALILHFDRRLDRSVTAAYALGVLENHLKHYQKVNPDTGMAWTPESQRFWIFQNLPRLIDHYKQNEHRIGNEQAAAVVAHKGRTAEQTLEVLRAHMDEELRKDPNLQAAGANLIFGNKAERGAALRIAASLRTTHFFDGETNHEVSQDEMIALDNALSFRAIEYLKEAIESGDVRRDTKEFRELVALAGSLQKIDVMGDFVHAAEDLFQRAQ